MAPSHGFTSSLVDFKLAGDAYPGWFSQGRTMRCSESASRLKLVSLDETRSDTWVKAKAVLSDGRVEATHEATLWDSYAELKCFIKNISKEPITLEYLTSFSVGGLSPFRSGLEDQTESLYLHRFRSTWAKEAMHERVPLESLQLEPSWQNASANATRFGSIGSMPVREWFPFLGLEDEKEGLIWAFQLASASSWQMELYRRHDWLSVSGGIADREFGHWMKTLMPGESFEAPIAYATVFNGNIDGACARLLKAQEKNLKLVGQEPDLPIIFNEFCSTWGRPSRAFVDAASNVLSSEKVPYFVLDAGWYKGDVGDWEENFELHPYGLREVGELLRKKGFVPGIWFEFECATASCNSYPDIKDLLLTRDGNIIRSGSRAFLDFRKPETLKRVREKVLNLLRYAGFSYIKIDYNETIGIGCDGAESLGEGLRQHIQAVRSFFEELRNELPDLLIEVCASGGHRLEPSMLALSSMASCSDAHECVENPIIAMELQRLILPRMSQIWAVLRKDEPEQRTYYTLSSGFYGRLCLSGDILDLSKRQKEILDEAIDLYRKAVPVIRSGESRLISERGLSYRNPRGWQASVRVSEDKALVVSHTFANPPETLFFTIPGEWGLSAHPDDPQSGYAPKGSFHRKGISVETRLSGGETLVAVKGAKAFDGLAFFAERIASE
ncbi:MAG: alpha-galactosidase [Clostridiales bacterium]|jgi:alpha-galactosidase|nr:alpha-galactosidase [Clostridiales bacterium]